MTTKSRPIVIDRRRDGWPETVKDLRFGAPDDTLIAVVDIDRALVVDQTFVGQSTGWFLDAILGELQAPLRQFDTLTIAPVPAEGHEQRWRLDVALEGLYAARVIVVVPSPTLRSLCGDYDINYCENNMHDEEMDEGARVEVSRLCAALASRPNDASRAIHRMDDLPDVSELADWAASPGTRFGLAAAVAPLATSLAQLDELCAAMPEIYRRHRPGSSLHDDGQFIEALDRLADEVPHLDLDELVASALSCSAPRG